MIVPARTLLRVHPVALLTLVLLQAVTVQLIVLLVELLLELITVQPEEPVMLELLEPVTVHRIDPAIYAEVEDDTVEPLQPITADLTELPENELRDIAISTALSLVKVLAELPIITDPEEPVIVEPILSIILDLELDIILEVVELAILELKLRLRVTPELLDIVQKALAVPPRVLALDAVIA